MYIRRYIIIITDFDMVHIILFMTLYVNVCFGEYIIMLQTCIII